MLPFIRSPVPIRLAPVYQLLPAHLALHFPWSSRQPLFIFLFCKAHKDKIFRWQEGKSVALPANVSRLGFGRLEFISQITFGWLKKKKEIRNFDLTWQNVWVEMMRAKATKSVTIAKTVPILWKMSKEKNLKHWFSLTSSFSTTSFVSVEAFVAF